MTATITPSTARPYARILSVGSYRPSRVVTNEEMCTMIDSTPEWIEQRTGIIERRWCTEEETLETMCLAAANSALDRAGIPREKISAVIVSTVSHFFQTPGIAPLLAHKLGLNGPAAWDVSAACAGFCHGLAQADAMVRSGTADYVLVIGSEILSHHLDINDRSTAFLFGDGAGAVVVGPSDVPAIGPATWGSDGAEWSVIQSERSWVAEGDEFPYIKMEGNKVFKWAISAVAQKAQEALDAAGVKAEDLDVFIPHQANNRIIDSMLRHLHLPDSVHVVRDIRYLGNTSAASIPLAMDAALESGSAKSGDTALLIGFGAGLVYAGQVVTLP